MNTLGDTDERKARPSVWPVYVAAGVLLVASLLGLFLAPSVLFGRIFGLFGVFAGIALVRLRPWGWWCGILFAGIWIPVLGMDLFAMILFRLWAVHEPPHPGYISATHPGFISATVFTAADLAVAVLVLVVLVARRQLFFPPKPEREE